MLNRSKKNLVEVYVAADEIEARYLERMLEHHDIPRCVVGAGLIGGSGELPPGWNLSPRIWVDQSDGEAAKQYIRQWEADRAQQRRTARAEWQCPSCKADVPGQFDICWQCRYDRCSDSPADPER